MFTACTHQYNFNSYDWHARRKVANATYDGLDGNYKSVVTYGEYNESNDEVSYFYNVECNFGYSGSNYCYYSLWLRHSLFDMVRFLVFWEMKVLLYNISILIVFSFEPCLLLYPRLVLFDGWCTFVFTGCLFTVASFTCCLCESISLTKGWLNMTLFSQESFPISSMLLIAFAKHILFKKYWSDTCLLVIVCNNRTRKKLEFFFLNINKISKNEIQNMMNYHNHCLFFILKCVHCVLSLMFILFLDESQQYK